MKKLFITFFACLMFLTTNACSKNDMVNIKVDALFFEGMSEEQIVADNKEMGLTFYTINKDGSVSYEMSKEKHQELLQNYKNNAILLLAEFASGEEKIVSFEDIEFTDNFDNFKVYVNEQYSQMDSVMAMPMLIMGAYYQNFSGVDIKKLDVSVEFIDQRSNEVLDELSFKEVMEA